MSLNSNINNMHVLCIVFQYGIHYDYNVYNFIQAQPNLLNWDISACYRDLDRRKFDFTVPGKQFP